MTDVQANDNQLHPLHVFRFQVDFEEDLLGAEAGGQSQPLCSGAFAECSGLEATMEPKVIQEGGRNYGAAQRMGSVSFATVVLKRGMTVNRHLWEWFKLVSNGAYAHRLSATVTLSDNAGQQVLAWKLRRALPVKFKTADLNARGSEVGVEELHLVHEGLEAVELPKPSQEGQQ
ncbi:MAG: phage tail protein [bacterium]|nr:phage tail protein [bacterium]